MDKVLNNEIVEEILKVRLPITPHYQKCSFILPSGNFLEMYEHYEAYKFLVVEGLVPCIPDAEQLLSDLGYVRYSWVGYVTLPSRELTYSQYKSLEEVLLEIGKYKDTISIQLQDVPRLYKNYELNDVSYIIGRIKHYYQTGSLLI